MRLKLIMMLFSLIYFVSGKNNVKTLTESNGQEVIEIGTPIKELPIGIEEEPGANDDDDDDDEKAPSKPPAKTQVPATKKEPKKTTTLATDTKADIKDGEKSKELNDEEEDKIEKELAEIYKDTNRDYKMDGFSDSGDEETVWVTKESRTTTVERTTEEAYKDEYTGDMNISEKPIGRQRNNFKFQPDSTDQVSVERFRTSVDEISCNNREKLKGTVAPASELAQSAEEGASAEQAVSVEQSTTDNAFRSISNGIVLITAVLCYVFTCI